MRYTVLFSPTARVYNLRVLLLSNIGTIIFVAYPSPSVSASTRTVTFISCAVITLHHILVAFPWRMRTLATIDLALVVIEICVFGYLVSLFWYIFFTELGLVALLLSALFRTSTIILCKDGLLRQQFSFLGGCTPVHPPYTPLSTLLNRSISRPLVRGESTIIVFARAVIISLGAVIIPFVAYDFIFVVPQFAQAYTRSIVISNEGDVSLPGGNATVVLAGFRDIPFNTSTSNIQVSANGNTNCSRVDSYGSPTVLVILECPYQWPFIRNLSISMSIPEDIHWLKVSVKAGDTDVIPDPTPVLRGSNLFGILTWTERRIRLLTDTREFWPTYTSLFIPDITALQPFPSNTGGASLTRLTLVNEYSVATRLLQDTADATVLSGIASFGGLWTFINSAFALVFGANVVYFAFGQRPLSALGVVHILQRGALVRQWHEDFPALHSEGGAPGTESAGIVAFIRERLVDVGDDPRLNKDGAENELEAQTGLDITELRWSSREESIAENDHERPTRRPTDPAFESQETVFLLNTR
ncbi:hypothetical protein FB451DRAFT_1558305 [Mycena latifolia]|nr:hypothetical protein FB451DRAFT_1558305 [Mycena latifolia]